MTGDIPLRIRWEDGRPVPAVPEECEPHTPSPSGYLQWHEWSERMADTHRVRACTGCGLYVIWDPCKFPGVPATAIQPVSFGETGDAA